MVNQVLLHAQPQAEDVACGVDWHGLTSHPSVDQAVALQRYLQNNVTDDGQNCETRAAALLLGMYDQRFKKS